MRRYVGGGALAAGVLTALVAACSTFTADDTSSPGSGPDAGEGDGGGDAVTSPRDAAPCEAGSCAPTLIVQSSTQIQALAVDAANVIWLEWPVTSENGNLRSCPKSGCPTTGRKVIADNLSLGFLASNGETAFVAEANAQN